MRVVIVGFTVLLFWAHRGCCVVVSVDSGGEVENVQLMRTRMQYPTSTSEQRWGLRSSELQKKGAFRTGSIRRAVSVDSKGILLNEGDTSGGSLVVENVDVDDVGKDTGTDTRTFRPRNSKGYSCAYNARRNGKPVYGAWWETCPIDEPICIGYRHGHWGHCKSQCAYDYAGGRSVYGHWWETCPRSKPRCVGYRHGTWGTCRPAPKQCRRQQTYKRRVIRTYCGGKNAMITTWDFKCCDEYGSCTRSAEGRTYSNAYRSGGGGCGTKMATPSCFTRSGKCCMYVNSWPPSVACT